MNKPNNYGNLRETIVDICPKSSNAYEWQSTPFQVLKSSSSVVIGLFSFQQHLIVVKMNGDIFVVDDDQLRLETAQPIGKVYLPHAFAANISSCCNKTLEYSEFDSKTGTLFFTMASKAGILSTPLLRGNNLDAFIKSATATATRQHHVVLDIFVRNCYGSDREFWGMAVDVDMRLLYCCNRRGKSSIGAWLIDNGQQVINYGVNDSWPYSFLQCCAVSNHNSAIVVSSSPSQRILLFDNCQDEIMRPFRFVSTVAGKAKKRHSDPTKFIINPLGMAFDSVGNLLIADCGSSRLQIFSPSNQNDLSSLTGEWISEKLWSSPRCVAVGLFEDTPTLFAGLHNGDVVCFRKIERKLSYY